MRELTFVIPNLPGIISLDIRDAEFLYNAMVVGNLAANLVVPQSDGNFAPGMAESWRNDGNRWIFKIRDGFKCQDGEPINAEGFRRSFIRALTILAGRHQVPVFDQLVGFRDFAKGDIQKIGIHALGDELVFEFVKSPKHGFIEYLSFPTLGYACSGNYKGDRWKDADHFIASGAFELESIQQGKKIVLRRRSNWYRQTEVDRVTFLREAPDLIAEHSSSTIITGENLPMELAGFSLIKEIPQTLGSVIIRPLREMQSREVRQMLADKIFSLRDENPVEGPLATKAEFFFPAQRSQLQMRNSKHQAMQLKQPLRILAYGQALMTPVRQYMENLLVKGLKDLGWAYTIDRPENRTQELLNSPVYDLKLHFAEVGGAVEGWIVNMHFAAYLGGKYPDPSGDVMSASRKFEAGALPYNDFVKDFNQAIYDDASVLPIMHMGRAWLVSDDIDHAITPVMSLPRFDEIRFKK